MTNEEIEMERMKTDFEISRLERLSQAKKARFEKIRRERKAWSHNGVTSRNGKIEITDTGRGFDS